MIKIELVPVHTMTEEEEDKYTMQAFGKVSHYDRGRGLFFKGKPRSSNRFTDLDSLPATRIIETSVSRSAVGKNALRRCSASSAHTHTHITPIDSHILIAIPW